MNKKFSIKEIKEICVKHTKWLNEVTVDYGFITAVSEPAPTDEKALRAAIRGVWAITQECAYSTMSTEGDARRDSLALIKIAAIIAPSIIAEDKAALLAHEAPKDGSAKTVPMEMLRGIGRGWDMLGCPLQDIREIAARYGYTVTESGKEGK